jgi:hypothetical protein
VPAEFLANDFGAIARAMRRETSSPPKALLHFWDTFALLTSVHDSVEAAVEEARALAASHTVTLGCISATDGTVLMDDKALAEAVVRYREGMPI